MSVWSNLILTCARSHTRFGLSQRASGRWTEQDISAAAKKNNLVRFYPPLWSTAAVPNPFPPFFFLVPAILVSALLSFSLLFKDTVDIAATMSLRQLGLNPNNRIQLMA